MSSTRSKSRRKGLGRGLSALIPDEVLDASRPGADLRRVPLDAIRRNPEQPRRRFSDASIDELAASIREHGLLTPLLLREEAPGRYVLVAGERRWRAAGRAGLTEVPALVTDRAEASRAQLLLSLVENLQREDLDPVDEALSYQRLVEDFGLSQQEVGRAVGKDRSTIANSLRLLQLPEVALEALRAGEISVGHAKALLGLRDRSRIPALLDEIREKGLSVRATERRVAELERGGRPARRARELPPSLRHAQELLRDSLGASVEIRPRKRGGRIVIAYSGEEELTALVERLLAGAEAGGFRG